MKRTLRLARWAAQEISAKRARAGEAILLGFSFLAALAVCCRIPYSDGDDAFFLRTVAAHPHFADFVAHLTRTMNGRVAASAALFAVFSENLWLWRIANAAILLLFLLLSRRLACLIAGQKTAPSPLPQLTVCAALAVTGVSVVGYAMLWITGSVNYLWAGAAGLLALYAPARSLFCPKDPAPAALAVLGIPAGCFACLAQEQIAAVVLAFLVLAAAGHPFPGKSTARRKLPVFLWVQLAATLAAFALFLILTLRGERTAGEVAKWLPEWSAMPLSQHIFLSVQWLAHGYANHLRYLLVLLWALLLWRFAAQKKAIPAGLCGLFSLAGLLPVFRLSVLTDVGLRGLDMTKKVLRAPVFADLSLMQTAVLGFWLAAILATPVLLALALRGERARRPLVLLFLAGLASAALMFLSPTIYASGSRTLFAATALLIILTACLTVSLPKRGHILLGAAGLGSLAVLQLLENYPFILSAFAK
ncbi:MAG: DUF6056 family protein [Oscillospiraceae bacterium]|jgi:hypothetical protein|nr:DUF6056 family protein [Oscillospiraceae bacterium]